MFPIKNISIPSPCHQSWQQMEERESGRYCTSCTKIVIDFTKMTNAEILDYLAGAKNVCGRFHDHQLTGINDQLGLKKASHSLNWKRWLVAAGLLGAGFFNKADAQVPTNVSGVRQQPVSKTHLSGKVESRRNTHRHPEKKTKRLIAETGYIKDGEADLFAYRSDISATGEKFKKLPEPVCGIDPNASTGLQGMLGGVSVSGIEINTQSRVEMFYQYLRWPINKLFK